MLVAAKIHALTGDEAIGRMQACMNGIKTMRGVISWSHSSGYMYTGNFKYMAPGKIFVKFTNPSGKIISSNGRKLFLYDPSSNICGVQELGRGGSGGIAGLVSGYQSIVMGGGGTYTIKLKNESRHYSNITLIVDSSFFLKKAVMKTNDGSILTISLSGIITGEGMSPGIFDFTPPSGAQRVENPLNIK